MAQQLEDVVAAHPGQRQHNGNVDTLTHGTLLTTPFNQGSLARGDRYIDRFGSVIEVTNVKAVRRETWWTEMATAMTVDLVGWYVDAGGNRLDVVSLYDQNPNTPVNRIVGCRR